MRGLPDSQAYIQVFDSLDAFVEMDKIEFWAVRVPPLTQREDFLGAIGGFGPLSGEGVMQALVRAVQSRLET